MESMIEHSITFKVVASLIGSGLLWIGVALGFVPAFDFVVLQVQENVFISEFGQAILNDVKIVFGALVPVLVAIKIYYEIKKVRKK